jgi:hypothetical protein
MEPTASERRRESAGQIETSQEMLALSSPKPSSAMISPPRIERRRVAANGRA